MQLTVLTVDKIFKIQDGTSRNRKNKKSCNAMPHAKSALFIMSGSTFGSGSAQSTATSIPHIGIFPGIIFRRAMAAVLFFSEQSGN
jgi:hypothetical protein